MVKISKKEYIKATKNKNWFSWGWLIFWIIISIPIGGTLGLIYLLIKYADKKSTK